MPLGIIFEELKDMVRHLCGGEEICKSQGFDNLARAEG